MPLLSIIITVYNLEKYIGECLDSVLDQDLAEYEIVLVNNASTDSSGEICERYAQKYDKIRYICLEAPSVLGRAHRVGFKEAKGVYCQFIDGDDYVAKGCYSDIFKTFNEKIPDLIFGSFECKPEKGARYLRDAEVDPKCVNDQPYRRAVAYISKLPNFHGMSWRYIFKKSLFAKNSPLGVTKKKTKDGVGTDELFVINLFTRAKSIYYYNKPFYMYRMRSDQALTNTITNEHFKGYFLNIIYMLNEIKKDSILNGFIYSRIKIMMKLFAAGCDCLTSNELSELAKTVEESKKFRSLKAISKPNDLYDFISRYGAEVGLKLYCTYEAAQTVAIVKGFNKTDIYVFPTGNSGENTARRLQNEGINVCGFFDNSQHKNGSIITDISCSLPTVVKEFTPEKINNSLVVIATVYENLSSILKKQLLDLGFPEKQIIIKK